MECLTKSLMESYIYSSFEEFENHYTTMMEKGYKPFDRIHTPEYWSNHNLQSYTAIYSKDVTSSFVQIKQKANLNDVLDAVNTNDPNVRDIIDNYVENYDKNDMSRLVQHHDFSKHLWEYYDKDGSNPCGCGSNCYHYEYDRNVDKIFGVCNGCNTDIHEIKEEYMQEMLLKGQWLVK